MNKGIVLELDMLNSDSTTVYDISRYKNNGTITGAIPVDKGYRFNGSSAKIVCSVVDSIKLTGMLSVEAWVKPFSIDTNMRIIYGTGQYTLWINSDNKFRFSDTISHYIMTDAITQTNNWYHVIGAFTGVSGDALTTSNIFLYVNGKSLGTSVSGNWSPTTLTTLDIGTLSASEYFNGIIGSVRIWNKALNVNEAVEIYNATKHFYR
jgi:hypothetical protein